MYNIGEGLDFFFKLVFWLLLIFIPLGVWKIIDIIMWVIQNVKITVG